MRLSMAPWLVPDALKGKKSKRLKNDIAVIIIIIGQIHYNHQLKNHIFNARVH